MRASHRLRFWVTLAAAALLATIPGVAMDRDSGPIGSGYDPSGHLAVGQPMPEGGTPGSLTTLFAANNGGAATGGVYFDLEAVGADDVDVTSWDLNLDAAFTGDVSVWYRVGTYSGFETAPAGWILVGTQVGVASAGNDLPTSVAVGSLPIPAGATYGIAISLVPTGGGTNGHNYTNGTGGNETYNDGVLELRAGSANNVAFSSGPFFPRVWNGTVYYVAGSGVPIVEVPALESMGLAVLVVLLAGLGLVALMRRRQSAV